MDIPEQISQLEEKIRKTPHHKGTEHQIGRWRARIAKLKHQMWGRQTKKAGVGQGYAVKRSGDATVVLVGPPSTGKSSLINRLSLAGSKVGSYDFTTLSVIPGMMKYKGAKIQIFDIPGIIKGAVAGKGRGREALSVVRAADLILIMVDLARVKMVDQIKKELDDFDIRLDERPPKVRIKKTSRGGLKVITTTPLSHVFLRTVKELAKEFRFHNAEIVIKEDVSLKRLIDALMGNRIYLPSLLVVNKIDLLEKDKKPQISGVSPIFISAQKNQGIEGLKKAIWQKLGLIRVYLKPKGKAADLDEPLVIKKGMSLKEILVKVGLPNKERVNQVKIYGPGAKFEGQEVSFSFRPQEGTIICFF